MERNKLEKQFKEKLNSREIKPADMAWDRLNAMLSVAETSDYHEAGHKRKGKFTWLYIAASCVGFLLISTVYFNQKENPIANKKNIVVIEKSAPTKNAIKSIKIEPAFSKSKIKPETKPLVQTQKTTKSKVENAILKAQKNGLAEIQAATRNDAIAENENKIPESIDNLLASEEKNQPSENKNPSIKINPADLLHQVDGELQISFREKAFNTITKKYKEAKEALANRNNQ